MAVEPSRVTITLQRQVFGLIEASRYAFVTLRVAEKLAPHAAGYQDHAGRK